jgi:hypothetical protein
MLETLQISLILLWAGLPLMMWLFRLVVRKRIHVIILYIVTVFIGYFVFVGCAWASDVLAEQRMNSFDIDGDGGIGGDELTPEAQEAIDDWASDTGRRLAFITGLPVTAIWAVIWLTPLCVGEWIVRRLIGKQHPAVTSGEVLCRPIDDSNPYVPPGSG